MCVNNYFVKLLMFSLNNKDYILLYGFSSPTNQETIKWKEYQGINKSTSIWKAIITKNECEKFFESLTHSEKINLGNKSFSSPQLFERPTVLSNDGMNIKSGPISKFRRVTEFWNVDKNNLYDKMVQCLAECGINGKEQYHFILELLEWLLSECGIDFKKNGYRFGNFESYHFSNHDDDFEIQVQKEEGLLKTSVRKKCIYNDKLIVNCVSEHRERIICNQTKIFQPEEEIIEFTAKEPMSQVVVQIWDEVSGELIFSQNETIMMGISIDMNIGDPLYKVKDPWSHALFKAASNRSDIIKEHIETVSHTSKFTTISIKSETHNDIDTALADGYKVFYSYQHSKVKGAFIKNWQKDGEIQSFLKIREYIELDSVKHVIIADPYFSIMAAAKILARISRKDVQLEVVTSLTNINPDTGEKTNKNEGEELQKFLQNNVHIIHPNLMVCNLHRGGKQVFHDRYLIRYFDDGKIDGFLLSNSLNSMGQFYPFIIAPMEYEVCLEVVNYLDEMRDANIQSKVNKNERISCEVLFDSKNYCHEKNEEQLDELPYKIWFAQWSDLNKEIHISQQDVLEAVTNVMQKWDVEKEIACKMLCIMPKIVDGDSSYEVVTEAISGNKSVADLLIEEFSVLAKDTEIKRNHLSKGKYSEEYTLWMLLNDKAKPSSSGFSRILDHAGHIWYGSDTNWLYTGYKILLRLNPERYMELLVDTKSPMMLDILVLYLLRYSWSIELVCLFIEKGSLFIQLICAECMFHHLKEQKVTINQCKEILDQLMVEKRVIQMVSILSDVTYFVRISKNRNIKLEEWTSFSDWLIESISIDIIQCSSDIQENAICWIHDCEKISMCKLLLNVANHISDVSVKNKLLDKAIDVAQKEILDCSFEKDIEDIVSLYLLGMEERFDQDVETEVYKQVIDWSVFETAIEPELWNYAYKKWRKAYISAKRQLYLLCVYFEKHQNSVKAKKYIDYWKSRIEKVIMDKD